MFEKYRENKTFIESNHSPVSFVQRTVCRRLKDLTEQGMTGYCCTRSQTTATLAAAAG